MKKIYKHPQEIEASQELIYELSKVVNHTAFDQMTRILYSTDASIYQMVPVGVVFPQNDEEVTAAVSVCAKHHVPVLPRGGGSSLAGQAIGHAVILDFSRYMNSLVNLDVEKQVVDVQPGMTLGKLNRQLSSYGLTYGPDPASGDRATIGGILGNNATGAHSIVYGMAHDHIESMKVTLADGSQVLLGNGESDVIDCEGNNIYQSVKSVLSKYDSFIDTCYPKTFRTVAGYNLQVLRNANTVNLAQLMIGSEGTLGVINSARLKLVRKPKKKVLALVHFEDLKSSLEIVPEILKSKPSAIEMIDKMLLDLTRDRSEYKHLLHFVKENPEVILIVEYAEETDAALVSGLKKLKSVLPGGMYDRSVVEIKDSTEQENVWFVRKVGLGIFASVKGDHKPTTIIEDAAVPVEHLAKYIVSINEYANAVGVEKVGLYAHASAGCIHVRPLINLKSEEGIRQLRQIAEKSLQLVLEYGGTTSGEHGEGIARGEFSKQLFGPEITQAFHEIKQIFDPENIMNPGKIVDTPTMDDESLLRYGKDYSPRLAPIDTQYGFIADGGFAAAVEMCNGAGVCRKEEAGVMCPSFQGTMDETHSTRGRANVLRAAMMGWLGDTGMDDDELYKVMDLCLSCQACKSECPSGVDMAKIKAEFLFQYYKENGFPLRSRLFAHISDIDALLQPFSGLANLGMKFPGKWMMNILGVHPARALPAIVNKPFSAIYKNLEKKTEGKPVVFFHDTFVEHNDPNIGLAAIKALEKSGYTPILLENKKCCGRPSVSKGLLHEAKKLAEHNIELLYPYAKEGIPIVGCEPSCMVMFVNEYLELVPGEKAKTVAAAVNGLDSLIYDQVKQIRLNWLLMEKNVRCCFMDIANRKLILVPKTL